MLLITDLNVLRAPVFEAFEYKFLTASITAVRAALTGGAICWKELLITSTNGFILLAKVVKSFAALLMTLLIVEPNFVMIWDRLLPVTICKAFENDLIASAKPRTIAVLAFVNDVLIPDVAS